MKNTASVFTRSHLPMYAQLAALLRQRIAAGEWAPGERLPTLEELIAEYQVARTTVRQAIGLLEEEEIIWRKQGKGTYVARRLDNDRWLPLATQWERLMHMIDGTTMRTISTEHVERPAQLPSEGQPSFSDWQRIQRVHSKGDAPYCVLDLYVATDIYEQAPSQFQTQLALRVISDLENVKVGTARQTLSISSADTRTAELLAIDFAAPVAEVKRVITTSEGVIFYYAEITYRGDFVRLDIDLLGTQKEDLGAAHGS